MTRIGLLNFAINMVVAAILLLFFPFDVFFPKRLFVVYGILQVLVGRYRNTVLLVWDEIKLCILSHFWFFIIGFLIIYPYDPQDIWVLLAYSLVCCFFAIFFARYTRIWFRNSFKKRVCVIGMGTSAAKLMGVVHTNRFSLLDIQFFVDCNESDFFHDVHQQKCMIPEDETIIRLEELDDYLRKKQIDTVIVAITEMTREDMQRIVNRVQDRVNDIMYLPQMTNLVTFDTKFRDFDGLILISSSHGPMKFLSIVSKRFIDIVISILGCISLIPLTIFVFYKNRLEGDKDPVFFRQERIGKDGKIFSIYKYRTMVPDADRVLERILDENPELEEEYRINKKLDDDPRITKAGRFLRAKSLDEFPQFINVLKGEMSLIGPRPYLEREVADMGEYYDIVIQSKPGLTGMWQTHGRSDVDFQTRLELDDYYVHNWNFWMDVTLFVKTVRIVLYGNGAR